VRLALTLAAALLVPLAACEPASYVAPRTSAGRPDFQGIWQASTTANWDLRAHAATYDLPAGPGVIVDPRDGQIPYQPWAAEQQARNFQARLSADPLAKCYLAGVPRTMYLPYPLQIFQTDREVIILSEYVHTWRWIPLDPLPRYEGYESWMGDPRGRWDGETLVVESVGFNANTWFDHSGNHHSDALKVTERLERESADTLRYEATIEDEKVFTRPWTIRLSLHRHDDRERILENECYIYAEEAGRPIRGSHPDDEL
jgi:hypothetical protein